MTKPNEIAAAANALLSIVATTFGRVTANMHETSVKLAETRARIQQAKASRQAA